MLTHQPKGNDTKIIRVFPRKTSYTPKDPLVFIGDPPLFLPAGDEVHVSVTFTWDIPAGRRLVDAWAQYYKRVFIGGPALATQINGFTPGMYIRSEVTFTSRGCNNRCPWCLVPEREGQLFQYNEFSPGNIIQDNNLLQCSNTHIHRVLDMLTSQHNILFTGGLDARLLTDDIIERLRSLRLGQLFFACDTKEGIKPLQKAGLKLKGLPRKKLRCYVLLCFALGETISSATARLEDVWQAGFIPFAQLYQPPDKRISYGPEWRRLQTEWCRPAATISMHKRPDETG